VQDAVAAVQKHASEASPQCEGQLPPRVVIDGAQAVGQIPVDVTAIGCDYYIGSGHKWLCGNTLI
jgi:selenocysteine lyase/cysteine desulfurase